MSAASIPLLTLSVQATAALTKDRFVTAGGAVATAAGRALGVGRCDAAIGDRSPVDVLGTTVVTAGGAIAADAAVEVGAGGKAVTAASGVKVGRLAPGSSAAADGDLVEIILIPN